MKLHSSLYSNSLLSLPFSVPASPHSITYLGNMESWGQGTYITICLKTVHTAKTVSIIMRATVCDATCVPIWDNSGIYMFFSLPWSDLKFHSNNYWEHFLLEHNAEWLQWCTKDGGWVLQKIRPNIVLCPSACFLFSSDCGDKTVSLQPFKHKTRLCERHWNLLFP